MLLACLVLKLLLSMIFNARKNIMEVCKYYENYTHVIEVFKLK
jgi:hypothetical protein